ncbi:MAG: NAD-dependent epimerase/dehydratase family protein [Thermoplasmata archaeon]
MTRVLITGVLGFIGSNLAKSAVERGWDVYGVDLWDASDGLAALHVDIDRPVVRIPVQRKSFSTTLRGAKADVVVHLAAEAIVAHSEKRPGTGFETNVMGTVNVLEACWARKVPCIVASSDKSYGNGPIPFLETDPLRPRFPYDTSKACQDLIAHSYFRTYGLPVLVTRAVNTYGPGDLNWTRLVPHTCRAALHGERPRNHRVMWTTKREWLYVNDLVSAYMLLASNLVENRMDFAKQIDCAVNVGSGQIASPSEVVPRILQNAGHPELEPVLEDAGFHQLEDEAVDSSRIRRLGWKPDTGLDAGLARTVGWYRTYLEGN